ncbi:hypothetical protein D7Y09_16735 [bacterium 1XD42-1]|nr:hypothetical protein [Oscillospiraceae bacterium]RKJ37205.1 hypothetical protein D7X25_31935 [bacterium 1XD42-8]RKJ60910.1 hypothetical protein D7Y09_16735 [bacterium 1XD42-1]
MEVENILAKNIAAAGDKAAYDACCKRLLANKIILAWIMKSCLEEYKDYDVQTIAEKYIEGDPQISAISVNPDEEQIQGSSTEDVTIQEGTITYDIRFFAIVPISGEFVRLILNCEAQNNFYPGYPLLKRGIFYCSRMISAQYGKEFTDSHYESIRKVYSIWVCLNSPQKRRNTITKYLIKEENLIGTVKEERKNYDLLTVIMICLGRPEDDNYTGILKLLEVLLSSKRKPSEKKKILQEDFSIKMTKQLESEVSIMCNLSEDVEQRGFEKGIAKGISREREENIRSLMKTVNWTVEEAMEALQIPEPEREKYANLLKNK